MLWLYFLFVPFGISDCQLLQHFWIYESKKKTQGLITVSLLGSQGFFSVRLHSTFQSYFLLYIQCPGFLVVVSGMIREKNAYFIIPEMEVCLRITCFFLFNSPFYSLRSIFLHIQKNLTEVYIHSIS